MLISLLLAAAAPTPELQQAIRGYFNARLMDGPSARYIWSATHGGKVYCGWVNAKNSFGAYTGFKPFMVMYQGRKITNGRIADDPNGAVVVETICKAQGYATDQPGE